MKLRMQKVGYSFIAEDPRGEKAMEPLPWRTSLWVTATRPRSIDRLNLFHALIDVVADGLGLDHDDVEDQLKISLGHFQEARLPSGVIVPRPKSISFEKMPDEAAFAQFFEKAVQAIYVLYGILPTEARRKIDELLAPKTERYR